MIFSDKIELVDETERYIDICLGVSKWQIFDGRDFIQKDYKVKGEIWRVHKNDDDPYPSNPHAHCVEGTRRLIGCKLHLGTRELFRKSESLGRLLEKKQFHQLIELIRPKFPNVELPLNSRG